MDKKKIILSISIIVFMIIVMIIYKLMIKGKSGDEYTFDQNVINEPNNKAIINRTTGTTVCRNIFSYSTITFTAKKDKITNSKFTTLREIGYYGYDNINLLTSEDKKQIESSILNELKLESFEYKGINIIVDYKEDVVITINIDNEHCDLSILQKLGIKFNDTYSNTIKGLLSTKEYMCE